MQAIILRDCQNGERYHFKLELPFLPYTGMYIQPHHIGACVVVERVKYIANPDVLFIWAVGKATDSDVRLMQKEGGWVRDTDSLWFS